ncbi:MAG: Uma2 family endonuclease, partial [Chloroflexota bacterium]
MYAQSDDTFTRMTEAEYLAFADEQDEKYEYVDGYVYAMSGGSVRHGIITVNISTRLNLALEDRDCSVTSPDTRVQVVSASKITYRYPDVTVFCGPPDYVEGRTDTIQSPTLVVEVLSPGTALVDRNQKLGEYTAIDSLMAYLLVSQDKMNVDRYLRHEDGQWLYQSVTGEAATVTVPPLGVTLRL